MISEGRSKIHKTDQGQICRAKQTLFYKTTMLSNCGVETRTELEHCTTAVTSLDAVIRDGFLRFLLDV